MYAKAKGSHVPSDIQAKDKLSLYVYEYLVHMGAKNAAQSFLNEVRFEKQVPFNISEPPGFLLQWWCIFWDLYCAAPERRDVQNECSNEAKAFHDYGFINTGGYNVPNGMPNSAAHSPLTQMPPQENMGPNNMQPNSFFSPNSQPPPPTTPVNQMMMQNQGYPRYSSGPRPMRVPSTTDYNGPNSVPGSQMGMDSGRVPPMNSLNRLTPPGGRMQNPPQVPPSALTQMGNYNSPSSQQVSSQPPPPNQQQPPNMGMRGQPPQGPPSQMGGPQMSGPNAALSPMPPMNMPNQPRWPGPQPGGPPMNYSSPSPVPYGAPCGPGPGTPIMQSPQDPSGEINYAMMKNVPGGMGYHDPNMAHMVPMNQHMDHNQHINGDMIDTLKNSPISNLQNTRHTDEHSNAGPINEMAPFSHFGDGSVQNESDAILKLKESMQEETKRFEKQNHHNDMYSECT